MYSTAHVAWKNSLTDATSGTYLPPNTREASYAIFPIGHIGTTPTVLKNYVIFKFHFDNIAAPRVEKQIFGPLTPVVPSPHFPL